MYQDRDFEIFADPTLPGRLGKIRQQLDPKFEQTVVDLQATLATFPVPLYAHVAQHRRRTKNPPPDSWVAFSTSKRGYKRLPHLEIGLWEDRLYIWLDVLEEATDRRDHLEQLPAAQVLALPATFKCADNHTDKLAERPLTAATYRDLMAVQATQRHAEWLVGRTFLRGATFFEATPDQQRTTIQQTVAALLPLYQKLI
ncbi:DUF1054 domain-containing protein [Levilactobacillus namurensis]|uniref:DUF1054 domain-containing protein n=1 Tax=Levilactobacillus namurensis TaxID=380393 RepID=UPI00223232C7|nr:DUF1054 domain-containing protein [Levilactobacillus namurensis]MCW3777874.1 DUF1054 domain-containing protein [Levilactobacillus namurensis]